MNAILRKDLITFLSIYHNFRRIVVEKPDLVVLSGKIDVVDTTGAFWDSYKVAFFFSEIKYPNVIPSVKEISEKIERDWDYHISDTGDCCLAIPHKLILMKNRGIKLIEFYRDVVYPFFANHQYRLAEETYANGEYEHFDDGIVQFYSEEHNLSDDTKIITLLKIALNNKRILPNNTCPICDGEKYKHCCRPIVNTLKRYGNTRLNNDLKIFEKRVIRSSLKNSCRK